MPPESLVTVAVDSAQIVCRVIAQAFVEKHADRIDKLVLLSTDPGGIEADLELWSELIDTSGTPNEQARRLLFLLFPNDVAESFYRLFAVIMAEARAQLSAEAPEASGSSDGPMAWQWPNEPTARDLYASIGR
jgi:pimeloyl-ACP methyl ester carboxylesterase